MISWIDPGLKTTDRDCLGSPMLVGCPQSMSVTNILKEHKLEIIKDDSIRKEAKGLLLHISPGSIVALSLPWH